MQLTWHDQSGCEGRLEVVTVWPPEVGPNCEYPSADNDDAADGSKKELPWQAPDDRQHRYRPSTLAIVARARTSNGRDSRFPASSTMVTTCGPGGTSRDIWWKVAVLPR
jgi:hypothetical protein